jgi:hypothetical protein
LSAVNSALVSIPCVGGSCKAGMTFFSEMGMKTSRRMIWVIARDWPTEDGGRAYEESTESIATVIPACSIRGVATSMDNQNHVGDHPEQNPVCPESR